MRTWAESGNEEALFSHIFPLVRTKNDIADRFTNTVLARYYRVTRKYGVMGVLNVRAAFLGFPCIGVGEKQLT